MTPMTPIPLEIHPQAIRDARAARRWYARRSVAAANQFVVALDHAIAQITGAPQSWPPYLHGTRFYRLRRYPYLVVYVEASASVQIIAVAHTSRRPSYWKRRV